MSATNTGSWDRFGRTVRVAVGLLLITSAALKLDDLLYGQASALLWLPSPRWVFAAIGIEALVGLWLLSGWHACRAWVASLLLFVMIAGISLTLALQGQSTCGCFGRLSARVSPWFMFLLDLIILGTLALVRPEPGLANAKPLIRRFAFSIAMTAVTLALASVILSWLGHDPVRILARLRGETLVVEPYLADLGAESPGEVRLIHVTLANHGEVPVRVVGGSSSCVCVTTDDLPLLLGGGETRVISIRMKFSGTPGRFQQRYILYWGNEEKGQRQLSGWLTGTVNSTKSASVARAAGRR